MEDNSDVDSDGSDIDIGNFDENDDAMMILNYVKSIEMPTNGQKRCLIVIQTMIWNSQDSKKTGPKIILRLDFHHVSN